jgi:hypothetical protein
VLAFATKAVLQPRAVRDVFSGTQAFAVAFGIGVAWLALWALLRRFVRNGWVRTLILAVVAGFLIFWLVVSALVDKKVVEALPGARPAAESTTGDATPAPVAAPPVKVATAPLRGIDHDATGAAVLYRRDDGSFLVGLEQIDIEPGPDYKLYIVPGIDRESPGDAGVFLDSLRGNQGTQYYEVPTSTELRPGEWTVLVWCRAFAVPIAHATPI